MKVLLFTIEYPPFKGGVANYYENIKKYWPEENKFFVLDNNNGDLIKNVVWPKWLPAIFCLWQYIRKYKIDYVLVGHILPLGTVTYFLSKIVKFKYSVILHGMDFAFATKSARKKNITRKILDNSEYIICGNSYLASMVKDFMGEDYSHKIKIVNPGIDVSEEVDLELVDKIKEKYHLKDKTIILSLGRLVKRKGVDKVLEAMPEVLRTFPDLYYVIVGDGPDKIYLKEKAKGIKNVIFTKATDEEKWSWMKACDIFIMPSRNIGGDFEGFGIVYLEANLMGKPVIAGNSGGVSDAVAGAVSGVLVDGENSERIAGAIINLASNKELREKLGEQGRKRAINDFNWKNQIDKIHKLIKDKNQAHN